MIHSEMVVVESTSISLLRQTGLMQRSTVIIVTTFSWNSTRTSVMLHIHEDQQQ